MKQSYPTGTAVKNIRATLTLENQGRLLVSDMAHVVMPNEKLLCGVCRKEILNGIVNADKQTCCGVTYTRHVHSYVIEAQSADT